MKENLMIENLEDEAQEELKRADHLIYITLKYTKTCDVLKSIIQRLINALNFATLQALSVAKKKKKIKEIPVSPNLRCRTLKTIFPAPETDKLIKFYFFLKKIDKSAFTEYSEYRKHLAFITEPDKIKIDIETITKFFKKTKDFVNHLKESEENL